MGRLTDYIFDAIRRPREQLTRGQHSVRYAWELTVYCYRQLQRHRAEGMAAELTYRTIFSLIPVVVLGLVMFRVVGGLDEVQQNVENQLYSFFGVPEIPEEYLYDQTSLDEEDPTSAAELTPVDGDNADAEIPAALTGPENGTANPDSTAESEDAQDAIVDSTLDEAAKAVAAAQESIEDAKVVSKDEEARRQSRASIRRTLHEVTSKVSAIDFASIGVFGLLLFIYAAVALADATEHLFNRIFDAPKHRPVHIRLAIHWSIITLGSGLLAMSLYMSGQLVAWAGTVGAGSTSQMILARLLSISASWVLLFLLYALMPNAYVSPKAAAIGSGVGSLLWEAAKFGFQVYVSTAVPYSALYGSLGLIPLFLLWIYVTWLIVLFGLILTYTLQTLRGRRLRRRDLSEEDLLHGDPDWMLPIMSEVAHLFQIGKTIDHQQLADKLGLPGRIVHEMVNKLVDAKFLRRVSAGAGDEISLTLAMPAEKIRVVDILLLAHKTRPTSAHPAWKTLANLKQAEREAAEQKTLADITAKNK
ncbi:MAG: YihY/virulence factor BrkB family protein [Pirellulaceae bacterium]|nr:YihY/virulence factor BrkB family protein [Pirellulaceae bacterium]